jgi:hypothetical protein
MVNQWGEEKERLESQMDKLAKQLENIKGRTNRQSRSSRDKMSVIVNDKQRSTVGDYKLETIQEIHDDIGDIDLKSNLVSEDKRLSFKDISPRGSIDYDLRNKSKDLTSFGSNLSPDHEPGLQLYLRSNRKWRHEVLEQPIPKLQTTVSDHDFTDRIKAMDETLNCRAYLLSGPTFSRISNQLSTFGIWPWKVRQEK